MNRQLRFLTDSLDSLVIIFVCMLTYFFVTPFKSTLLCPSFGGWKEGLQLSDDSINYKLHNISYIRTLLVYFM